MASNTTLFGSLIHQIRSLATGLKSRWASLTKPEYYWWIGHYTHPNWKNTAFVTFLGEGEVKRQYLIYITLTGYIHISSTCPSHKKTGAQHLRVGTMFDYPYQLLKSVVVCKNMFANSMKWSPKLCVILIYIVCSCGWLSKLKSHSIQCKST